MPYSNPESGLGFTNCVIQEFLGIIERRKAPIKAVLLNQSVAAGIGNWIADEVLYQVGTTPHINP